MHAIATAAVAAAAALLAITPACAVSWQDHQTAELEHLLVDTSGFNDAGFARGVTPCSFYVSGAQNTGRTSAGQWMRVAFHDFATFDAAAGTGGIDASIGWETMREENKGAAMNDSMGYWAGFVNKYTTSAYCCFLSSSGAIGYADIGWCSGRHDRAWDGRGHSVLQRAEDGVQGRPRGRFAGR